MSEPIHLLQRFGSRFRIAWDGAYNPKNVPRDKLDSSYMEIPCRFGTIYAYDENNLAVMVDYHRKIAAILSQMPGVEILQDGDAEKTYRFPVEMFDEIAAIVKPHRKPQLTEEQKRDAVERLREFHSLDPLCLRGLSTKTRTFEGQDDPDVRFCVGRGFDDLKTDRPTKPRKSPARGTERSLDAPTGV